MKVILTIKATILLLGSYGFAQESLIETNQKMMEEIQNEFKEFLSEISMTPLGMGSEKPVPLPNEKEIVDPLHNKDNASIPDIYPVNGIPRITSLYGYRNNPFQKQREFHEGIDIAVVENTDVLNTASGIVAEVGYDRIAGRYIIIDHDNGYRSYYGHLSSYQVKLGDSIKKGQVIAKSGKSGKVTGPHLHYTVYAGEKTINPLSIIH